MLNQPQNPMNTVAKKWNCLIVDDEPLAREVVRRHIEQVPVLKLVGECNNSVEVLEALRQLDIDIIFLDIQLPGMKGNELLKNLKEPPNIIVTTAFPEYALEGYELDIVDYLLKPIKFERFLKAVLKVIEHDNDKPPAPGPIILIEKPEVPKDDYLYFRTDRKTVKVFLNDILYIEGLGNYIKIYTSNGVVITNNSMKTIEAMLPENLFIRVHRSFIISKTKISSYNNDKIEIGKVEIPVGKLYKNNISLLE